MSAKTKKTASKAKKTKKDKIDWDIDWEFELFPATVYNVTIPDSIKDELTKIAKKNGTHSVGLCAVGLCDESICVDDLEESENKLIKKLHATAKKKKASWLWIHFRKMN